MRRRNTGGTYSAFAEAEATQVGGRFGAVTKAKVIGSSDPVQYPSQPPNSPWADDPVGLEPSLGAVDEMVPVGEAFEVAQSLGDARSDGSSGPLFPVAVASALPGDVCSAFPQAPGAHSPPSKQKRWRTRHASK